MLRLSYRCWSRTSGSTQHAGKTQIVRFVATNPGIETPEFIEKPLQDLDKFTQEFLSNRIQLTEMQKIVLAAGSSIAALVNPRRHDMIACLGETTGEGALIQILEEMKKSDEGLRILEEKPRINTITVNLDELKNLPEDTFGYQYYKFLDDNVSFAFRTLKYNLNIYFFNSQQVTPDSRMEVRFMENPELAYVMTRYRETHDLVHTILGMPTNMLGEVAVKWVEALNTRLPMCYGGAVFGALRLRPK